MAAMRNIYLKGEIVTVSPVDLKPVAIVPRHIHNKHLCVVPLSICHRSSYYSHTTPDGKENCMLIGAQLWPKHWVKAEKNIAFSQLCINVVLMHRIPIAKSCLVLLRLT